MQAQQSCKEDVSFHPKHQGYVHIPCCRQESANFALQVEKSS